MSGDGINTLTSTATFKGVGEKNSELDAIILKAALENDADENTNVADGIGIGIFRV